MCGTWACATNVSSGSGGKVCTASGARGVTAGLPPALYDPLAWSLLLSGRRRAAYSFEISVFNAAGGTEPGSAR